MPLADVIIPGMQGCSYGLCFADLGSQLHVAQSEKPLPYILLPKETVFSRDSLAMNI